MVTFRNMPPNTIMMEDLWDTEGFTTPVQQMRDNSLTLTQQRLKAVTGCSVAVVIQLWGTKCLKGKFLAVKLITSPFNLSFNVSQRGQRTRVQMFYLLTCWVEKLVGDVNVYERWAETTKMLVFSLVLTLSGETRAEAHRSGCYCGEESVWSHAETTSTWWHSFTCWSLR